MTPEMSHEVGRLSNTPEISRLRLDRDAYAAFLQALERADSFSELPSRWRSLLAIAREQARRGEVWDGRTPADVEREKATAQRIAEIEREFAS